MYYSPGIFLILDFLPSTILVFQRFCFLNSYSISMPIMQCICGFEQVIVSKPCVPICTVEGRVSSEVLSCYWRTTQIFTSWCCSVLLFRILVAIFSPHDLRDDNRQVICTSDLSCHKKYMFIWQTTLGGDCKWFAIFLQLSFWQFICHRRSFQRFTKMGVSFILKQNLFWTVDLLSSDVRLHKQPWPSLLLTKLPDFLFLETANHHQCCKSNLWQSLLPN